MCSSAALGDQTIEQIIVRGLHEFLDWVQLQLQSIQNDVAEAFWALPVVPAEPGPVPTLG